MNNTYSEMLQNIVLSDGGIELFKLILADANASEQQSGYLRERRLLLEQISEQESFISKARKLYLNEKIDHDDFSALKNEYGLALKVIKDELEKVNVKLDTYARYSDRNERSYTNIFSRYKDLDLGDKRIIANLITPGKINANNGSLDSLVLNSALSKILSITKK